MSKHELRRQKKSSQRQEKKAAEDIGGRVVAGSGAAKYSGGSDVRVQGEVRVECKQTQKEVFVVTKDVLNKIRREAIQGGLEEPVLHLQFLTPIGGKVRGEFAIRPHIPHADPDDCTLLELTTRSRIRLHHADLVRLTADGNEAVIGFERKLDKPTEWWDILRWSDYCRYRQSTEDEC